MFSEVLQSARGVRRNPGFALLSIGTLALGIGISTAVFSVVNGVLLEPLAFPQPDRIVSLNTKDAGRPSSIPRVTGGDFVDLRTANKVFDAVSVYFGGEMGVQLRDRAEFTGIRWVNPEFFTSFRPECTRIQRFGSGCGRGVRRAAFWRCRTRASVKPIQVESRVYEIAAVLKGPRFPADTEIWLPAPYVPENLNRTAFNYRAVARLRSGVSIEQAQANLDNIAAAAGRFIPEIE